MRCLRAFAILAVFVLSGLVPAYAFDIHPVTGPQSVLVVATEFRDARHSPVQDLEYLRNLVFVTVSNYFSEASYNRTWLVGKVTDRWYMLSQNASFYAPKELPLCQRKNWESMVAESLKLASRDEDLAAYRFFIVAHTSSLWPTNCGLSDNDFSTASGRVVRLRGVVVRTDRGSGTWAHELGHSIGYLPDMYAVANNEPDGHPFVGPWDLMDIHSFKNPQHFSVWSKIKMGWIDPSQVLTVKRGDIVNTEIHPQEIASSSILAITIPLPTGSYYLLELRQRIGFDKVLPDHGVLVYLVDETKNEWGQSPIVAQNPDSSRPLDYASLDLRNGKQAAFVDRKNDVCVVVTDTSNSSYRLFVGSVDAGETVLADSQKKLATMKFRIDGSGSDWAGVQPIIENPQGTSSLGTPGTNLKAVYGAADTSYLYVMIETWGNPDPGNNYIFPVDLNGDKDWDYSFGFNENYVWMYDLRGVPNGQWPEDELPMPDAVYAVRDVAEIAIPLQVLGSITRIGMLVWIYYPSLKTNVDQTAWGTVTFTTSSVTMTTPRTESQVSTTVMTGTRTEVAASTQLVEGVVSFETLVVAGAAIMIIVAIASYLRRRRKQN